MTRHVLRSKISKIASGLEKVSFRTQNSKFYFHACQSKTSEIKVYSFGIQYNSAREFKPYRKFLTTSRA